MTLLQDAEWAAWSDREIARRAGVSQPTVGAIRRELSDKVYQMPASRTVERNGTTYTQNTANIGRPAQASAPVVRAQIGSRQGQRTDRLVDKYPHLAGVKTREVAAEKAGFGNSKTYEQARTVVQQGVPELVEANFPKILGKSQARNQRQNFAFDPIPQFLADYPAAIIITGCPSRAA